MKSSLFTSFAAATVFAFALGFPVPAAAHTRLVTPTPLSPDDNAKSGPCGCFFGAPQDGADDLSPVACPEMFSVMTLQAGTELTVEWQETVNHDGSFRIAFSPKTPQEVTKADMDAVAMPEIPDANTTPNAMISQKVTVPSEPCELCTLQVRQLMTGAPNPYYYTCAAIRIVTADASTGTTMMSGGAGGAPGAGGQGGASDGGGGGQGGTTGAGMADPPPVVKQGCSAGASPVPGSGALAIVGLSLAAGLLRKRRRG